MQTDDQIRVGGRMWFWPDIAWVFVSTHCMNFFAGLLHATRYLQMPSSTLFMTPMRMKKTLVFATVSTEFFCFFFHLVSASRSFLSNETTVCQRQYTTGKNQQNCNHKIDWQTETSEAGRFIAQDHPHLREEKRRSQWRNKSVLLLLFLVLKCILVSRFCLSLSSPSWLWFRQQNNEVARIEMIFRFLMTFFAFIIIFRFHLIIQTFYQPTPSPPHTQREGEKQRKRNLTMCLMIYIDNVLSTFFYTYFYR